MTDQEVIYRFTPPFEGAFLQGVPRRDLTQRDVDRMTGQERADAFTPHPVTGKTLYTAVEGIEKKAQERQIAAVEKAIAKDGAE